MSRDRVQSSDFYRLILVLLPCLIFITELIGVEQFAGWDVTRLNLPLKWYDVQSVREGTLPLWNHFLYTGMPQLAESESGLFYIGNILLDFPGNFFVLAGLTYIIHFIMAGLFMDLWLRGRGIKPLFSFIGAVLFQTAPFLMFHISSMALLQSVVWFPLLLWLADRLLNETDLRTKWFYGAWIAVLGGILVTIGSGQMAFYQGLLLIFYLAGFVLSEKANVTSKLVNSIGVILSLVIGAVFLGAVVWIPTQEFSAATVRELVNNEFFKLGSNWLSPLKLATAFYFPAYGKQTEVIGWVSSLFYVGLLPSILAILRLTGIRINWKKDAPLIFMGGLALFLAFGMLNPANHLLVKLPVYSLFRYQGRLAIGILVALIALSAHYLSSLNDAREAEASPVSGTIHKKPMITSIVIVLIILIIFLLTAVRSNAILIGGIVLIVDALLSWWVISSINRRLKKTTTSLYSYLVFHLIVIFPVTLLFTVNTGKFNETMKFFDHIQREDGQPARLLAVDVGYFSERDLFEMSPRTNFPNMCAGNTSVFYGVQTMDPFTPLRPIEWDRIIRGEILKGFIESGESGRGLGLETALKLEFLGVDYIVTSGGVTEIPGYSLDDDIDLSISWGDGARLFKADREQPRVWALALSESGKIPVGTLELTRNGARAEIDSPSYTVIVEISYDENWLVTVDGNPILVNPHQGVFCEINTGTGEHSIEFQYQPESVKTGMIVSAAGIALVLLWIFMSFPRKRPQIPLP